MAVFGLSSAPLRAESASTFFKRGQSAEAREDYDAAFDNLPEGLRTRIPRTCATAPRSTACGLPPRAMHVTKGRKLLQAGNEQGALAEFLHAAEIDPGNEAAQQAIARVRKKNGEVAPTAETSLPEPDGQAGGSRLDGRAGRAASRSQTSR